MKVGSDGVYGYLGMVFVLLPKFDLAEELAGLVVDLQLAGPVAANTPSRFPVSNAMAQGNGRI